ncbi:MAG: hypothetical protein ACXVH7_13235, partial [Thermoanaerobaculia bacterium]
MQKADLRSIACAYWSNLRTWISLSDNSEPNNRETGEDQMPIFLTRRRVVVGGGLFLLSDVSAHAAVPEAIVGGAVIGREKLLVVREDAGGRIVALDSGAYL